MFPISKAPISEPQQTRDFRRNEQGNVALMFGLAVTAACLFSGLAIDVGRTYSSKAKLGQAADAAVLAAVKGMRLEGLSDDAAAALARRVFDENMRNGSGNWTNTLTFSVVIDRATSKAVVDVRSSVRTAFAGLAGIPEFTIPTIAAAVLETGNIEVSLQLDLTGSMCDQPWLAPCSDHRKIQGLKNATKDLVDILLPDVAGPSTVRVAFAPFTAGVNLGVYQGLVTGGRTTANGCVYERRHETNQKTDFAPVGDDRYMVAADLRAAPYNVAAGNLNPCPNAPVVPLTSDKDMLKRTVDAYVADGVTAGHNGTAWAWNLISPTFSTDLAPIWPTVSAPAAYSDTNTSKTAILMTDGAYNSKNGMYIPGRAGEFSQIAVDTCTAMKAAGIRVYTVGFELAGNVTAINTLTDCASNPSDFYEASNAEELGKAFRAIANDIVRLRLTN